MGVEGLVEESAWKSALEWEPVMVEESGLEGRVGMEDTLMESEPETAQAREQEQEQGMEPVKEQGKAEEQVEEQGQVFHGREQIDFDHQEPQRSDQ